MMEITKDGLENSVILQCRMFKREYLGYDGLFWHAPRYIYCGRLVVIASYVSRFILCDNILWNCIIYLLFRSFSKMFCVLSVVCGSDICSGYVYDRPERSVEEAASSWTDSKQDWTTVLQ